MKKTPIISLVDINCRIRQFSDQTICETCSLVWDTNDPSPPKCRQLDPDYWKETPMTDTPVTGVKYDGDKIRMDLLPPRAMLEVAKVLTFGAKKYSPDNWRKVDGLGWRYLSAEMRHVNAWQRGETDDAESTYHHLAHAICCLSFILEDELMKKEGK